MWEKGRQGTGYLKKKLFSGSWFDCYLIKLPTGSYVPPHVDKVPGKRHYRLNIYLPPKMGGYFMIDKPIVNILDGVFTVFRSDEQTHSVSKILEGEGTMLSFGWVLDEDDYVSSDRVVTPHFAM